MESKCNIIRDILPLYVENMVSDDTRQFVDEHLSQCQECKQELEQIKLNIPLEEKYQDTNTPATVLKRIGLDIKKKRIFTGVLSATISAIILILLFAHLTAPQYLSYTESLNLITVNENNGIVSLSLSGEYRISQREQGVYDISIYNTQWNKLFNETRKQTITVNPNGDNVRTIYYVSNGGQEDRVIYGENPNINGGVITLPRLVLNYYFILSILAVLVLFVFCFVFRKKEKVKDIMVKILFMPISYVISHIMIKGFNAVSYTFNRDFYFILFLTIPIYLLFYTLYKRKG